jgi:hypothetical protein
VASGKGELTVRAHTPAKSSEAWFALQAVSMGFSGTYTDDAAEFDATALVGKMSVQMKVIFRLLRVEPAKIAGAAR